MADLGALRRSYQNAASLGNLGSGIAPYGTRYADSINSVPSAKGNGFFGMVPSIAGGDASSELSSAFTHKGQIIEHPLMVPTLSAEELKHLLSGAKPTPEIYDKAETHALMRLEQGKNPFAGPEDLRYPVPK